MLVRRLIGKKLGDYYAQPSSVVVGGASPLTFSSLWGEWHWRWLYSRLYKQQEGQWLTPVELFQPHYSNIVANFVAQAVQGERSVEIVELGGGRGTNARLVLDHLLQNHKELYHQTRYRLIDASPTLHKLQQETISTSQHIGKVDFQLTNLLDVAEGTVPALSKSDKATVVIALELFDNLPHDKIRVRAGPLIDQAQVSESDSDGEYSDANPPILEEVFVPLSDGLLKSTLQHSPSYLSRAPISWVPTVACGVLEHLFQVRPRTSLLVADFDWLPLPDALSLGERPVRTSAVGAGEPLVTSMDGVDHDCYLQSPPYCDILFPTDFRRLASFVKKISPQDATVHVDKQSDFLHRYGPDQVEATASWLTGFTPLLQDFANCSVLTVTQRGQPKRS